MRLNNLTLTNFRGVESLSIEFSGNTTVLVGVNGVGKSAILDALAILFSQLTWRINGQPAKARPIAMDDIRVGKDHAKIEISICFQGESLSWSVALNRRAGQHSESRKSELQELNQAVNNFGRSWSHVEEDRQEHFNLPLVVFYDVHRAVLEMPMRVREKLKNNPYEAYHDALDHGGADFKRFFIWFRNREDWENEQRRDDQNFSDGLLTPVRNAIEVFTRFKNMRIRRYPLRMTVEKDDLELNVAQLSDGEKCLLALVGDLARRLTLLNPGRLDPLTGDGVVLIDEIDLHLHPKWQREIIPALERTFPNCQFVVSTHSPQVLSHVKADQVWLIRLDEGALIATHPQVTFGLDSSRILEEIMDVPEREGTTAIALKELFGLLETANLVDAREKLQTLKNGLGDIPELVRAEALLRRKEILGR